MKILPMTVLPSCLLQNTASHVSLDSVPYAADGMFAVNLWSKLAPGGTSVDPGELYQYLFSHVNTNLDSEFGPDQVRQVTFHLHPFGLLHLLSGTLAYLYSTLGTCACLLL